MNKIIDPSSCAIKFDDNIVQLTRGEFCVFYSIFKAKGRVMPHRVIMTAIEDEMGRETSSNVLEVLLSRVRKKIKPYGVMIKNVHNIGFRIMDNDFTVLPSIEDEVAA